MSPETSERRGGEYVYDALVEADIELLVGLPGTQTLPLDRTVTERDDMTYVMARHETAIPHIAWGYFEATESVAATLTVPGPGDTNAMHGLKNAAEDCVPIVHISADVNPEDRGKGPIHEIEADTFDNVVKLNVSVERPTELTRKVSHAIRTALSPPSGPVRLGIPSNVLDASFDTPGATVEPDRTRYENDRAYSRATDLLSRAERPVVYVGGGARRSSGAPAAVRDLVTELDAPVVASFKGKGVLPEDDPHWMGTTAAHLPAGARRILEVADVVLAIGTDFDGVTTDHWSIPAGEALVHINLDPGAIGRSYPADVAIVEDAATAVAALGSRLEERSDRAASWDGGRIGSAVREEYRARLRSRGLLDDGSPAHTPAALLAIRDELPRGTVVTTDVGGFRLWSKQLFEASGHNEYITAGSWAGMGVGLPAAIGAKLGRPTDPVVCLTGDGGLMMCIHELHTAAEYDLDLTVVVFDNRDYGIISKSPKIEQYTEGHEFTWDPPDFATIAEGFGCAGHRADSVEQLRVALQSAMEDDGPAVIDLLTDTEGPSAVQMATYESTVEL